MSKVSAYFGSKAASGLFQNIIAMMPPHETYIETHLGGGAIMKRKPPTVNSIGIDMDPRALDTFKCPYPVHLINGCAHEFLAHFNYTGLELIYCDPPYLMETRTSDNKYRFEYEQQDHISLLKLIKTLPCQVIISGYPSSLYDDNLSDWKNIELQVMSRGGPRTEKIWYNYEINRVYWAGFAGKDFTDRQRIKRKAQRWGKKYQALPKGERLAILASIMKVEEMNVAS
jgi:DNA adenine methylase